MKGLGRSALAGALVLALAAGCVPNKQQGAEDRAPNNPAKFDTYGINLKNDNVGMDKGPVAMLRRKQLQNREPHLVAQLERHAERIPGVVDIKVIAFKDNLLIGVLPSETPKADTIDPTPRIPYTPGKPSRIYNGHTDRLQMLVAGEMRSRLQAETGYNIMYVCTNRAIYDRIADLHERIVRGEAVADGEFQSLLNDIGYTVKGFDLVG
ncbi:sporulation protein [Brevibacillus sp. H7]|uniref:sporulation protein n=1 Tax=Brevibacillus sp. H7 TaxID=3349138 RepID=UPI003B7BB35E